MEEVSDGRPFGRGRPRRPVTGKTTAVDGLEVHVHDVEFDDVEAPFVRVEADDEVRRVDARNVERS